MPSEQPVIGFEDKPFCCHRQRVGYARNRWTGQIAPLACKTWKCAACGEKKRKQITAKIIQAFDGEKFCSLWTFTASTSVFSGHQKHSELMRGAWRRFVVKIRQGGLGYQLRTKLKYFRVVERFKSGYFHFHVMLNMFLPYRKVEFLWMQCVLAQANSMGIEIPPDRKFSNANVAKTRGAKPSHAAIASYVAKYVSKTLQSVWSSNCDIGELDHLRRVWSASRQFVSLVVMGPKKSLGRLWVFHRGTSSDAPTIRDGDLDSFPYRVMLQALESKIPSKVWQNSVDFDELE